MNKKLKRKGRGRKKRELKQSDRKPNVKPRKLVKLRKLKKRLNRKDLNEKLLRLLRVFVMRKPIRRETGKSVNLRRVLNILMNFFFIAHWVSSPLYTRHWGERWRHAVAPCRCWRQRRRIRPA